MAAKAQKPSGITSITVSGYKSLGGEHTIEVRPLTILAGANSSGKSSIMQPLLLLKQTLEAPFDPGPLLLNGPNLKFTAMEQLLTRPHTGEALTTFSVGFGVEQTGELEGTFGREQSNGVCVQSTLYRVAGEEYKLRTNMSESNIINMFQINDSMRSRIRFEVIRERCFLKIGLTQREVARKNPFIAFAVNNQVLDDSFISDIEVFVSHTIHLPGLRGNPQRTYPVSAVGPTFPGTFEKYTASVISHWQTEKQTEVLESLFADLKRLNLTWKVTARRVNEAEVELQVGRLERPTRGGRDLVNIADVGFGVSQVLPVLVALHAAQPGQLVYIEQPELHLHPHQVAMAQVLANAARRGVHVVAETHSDLLLLAIQTLVAQGELSPDLVKLHWFQRGKDGLTTISSADLDALGTFGDWPIDFDEVAMGAERAYLDVAEIPKEYK